tara:strand:+ start:609 stop:938 length:330 start_codon:yes stop_codon:yes gene_type:complete
MPNSTVNRPMMANMVGEKMPMVNAPLISQNVGAPNPVTPMPTLAQMAVPNTQANNIMNGTTNSVNRMQGSKQRTQSDMVNQLNGRRRPVRTRAFKAMNRMRGNAMRGYR